MRVLITGICGFVGSTLAEVFLNELPGRVEVFGIDNLMRAGADTNRLRIKGKGAKFYHGDVRNPSDLESLPNVDWVVDAAASPTVLAGLDNRCSSRQLMEHNLIGTVNLLEYCKRHSAGLILLSTSRVYSINKLRCISLEVKNAAYCLAQNDPPLKGVSGEGINEDFECEPPLSLYGATKRASELLAIEYSHTFNLPLWVNRCGVLAGASQFGRADQGIYSFWIHSWCQGRPLRYIGFDGAGNQVRDCLHPRDLAELTLKQMRLAGPRPQIIHNVAGGIQNAVSLKNLSSWCEQRFGPRQVTAHPEQRQFDIPWLVLDSTKAKRDLGWSPRTSSGEIFEEIAEHAEKNPNWLDISE